MAEQESRRKEEYRGILHSVRIANLICTIRSAKFSSSRGSSILEQAIVYPLLLGVVVTAVDVSRVLQGYSVLDQGMRSALRCVSPANGECINASSSTTNALYDIYENTSPTRYRLQQHQYVGTASWIAQPVNQISRIQAAVVSEVGYQADQFQYGYQLEKFRPQGVVGYAVETRTFPYVTRESVPFLLPRIQNSETSSQLADPVVRIGAPEMTVRHVSRRNSSPGNLPIPIGEVKFTIPRAAVFTGSELLDASENCFLNGVGGVDFSQQCGSARHFASSNTGMEWISKAHREMNTGPINSRAETDRYAFVLIDIRGNVSSSTGARGRVLLRVSQPGGINRELGGRIISGSGSQNFVPRGAPPSFYSATINSGDAYAAEVNKHQAILLKLGVEATLHFEIDPDDRNADLLEWRASEVSIYAPRYESRTALATCDTLISRQGFATNPTARCPKSLHPAGMPRPQSLSLPTSPEQVLRQDLCLAGAHPDGNQVLQSQGIAEAEHYRKVSGPSSQSCGREVYKTSCPDNNGIAGLGLSGFDDTREVCGSTLAQAVCPLPAGVDFGSACWKITGKDVTPAVRPQWIQRSCLDTALNRGELPDQVLQYPEILQQSERLSGITEPLYTGGVPPSDFKRNNPELDCSAMKIDTRQIGHDLTELKPESLFRVTSSLGLGYRERLFTDAQHSFVDKEKNIHPGVYFEASENIHLLLVDAPPSDPQQIYWVEPGGAGEWKLIASHVADQQTPEQCRANPERCRREIVSISSSGPTGPDYSAERAAAIGYQAVQAAMPSLARSCFVGSKSCANLRIEEEQDGTGKVFVARGEIRVPLILSPRPYTISRVSRARWERDLIDK